MLLSSSGLHFQKSDVNIYILSCLDLKHTSLDLFSVQHLASVPAHTSTQPTSLSLSLRFSPTQRRGDVGRPTSAAGPAPEESNVTSGGTLSPAVLCSQDLNMHKHTPLTAVHILAGTQMGMHAQR